MYLFDDDFHIENGHQKPIYAFDRFLDETIEAFERPKYYKTPQAVDLEKRGWKTWLRTLAPKNFRKPFADAHIEYWNVVWKLLHKKALNIPLTTREYTILYFVARGYGKSTNGEMTSIAEPAIVGYGNGLYLSDTDSMAEEHLYNVVEIIEYGQIEQFYPKLAKPKIKDITGAQAEFTKQAIITEGNWSLMAKGLRGNVRGARKGNLRFTSIFADDIDRLDESILMTEKKKRNIARSILPAGDTKMMFFFLQNVIGENSIANQVNEGKTDILSENIQIGGKGKPIKAFKEIEIKSYTDENGNIRHKIVRCIPNWEHFDVGEAKKFLAQSGKEAFLAEYQHEFDTRKGKVIFNFNRNAHVITWDMFEKVFGKRYIPEDWLCVCGSDIGYTDKSLSAWSYTATAAKNTKLPGKLFTYRGRTFTRKSIGFQMLEFWKDMFPKPEIGKMHFEATMNFGIYPELFRKLYLDPKIRPYLKDYKYNPEKLQFSHKTFKLEPFFASQIVSFQISHEKSGELLTIQENYGVPFRKIENFGKADGVTQWNDLLECDHTQPHPFLDDVFIEDDRQFINEFGDHVNLAQAQMLDENGDVITGFWKIGCPNLFYIVDTAQYKTALDDRGLKTHLENTAKWKYIEQVESESGYKEEVPQKKDSDTCDSERANYSLFGAGAKELTKTEAFDLYLLHNKPHLLQENINALSNEKLVFAELERQEELEQFEKEIYEDEIVKPKGTDFLDF